MRNLPKIETVEQAREVLIEMDEEQEITAELDEWKASIRKHNGQEFSVRQPRDRYHQPLERFPHTGGARRPRPVPQLSVSFQRRYCKLLH